MAFSNTSLDYRESKGGSQVELLEPLVYADDDTIYAVPKGFKTDLTSSPFFTRSLVPKWGRHNWAAILHDYLYSRVREGKEKRKDADRLLERSAKDLGVWWWRRKLMYGAVRLFGWRHV